MKTRYLLLLPLLPGLGLFAQKTKGVVPLSAPSTVDRPPSTVRAVVVGISDYQSPQIPNLQFADKDAGAFAKWLKSPAGGALPASQITLLLNEKATFAQVTAALDGLAEETAENDLAIIYFSGHGDIESKTAGQLGFLLTWDTPPRSYKAGAYSLVYLQDVISTLSTVKKARVLVITDACHSGKLAGSDIGGAQATALNLARQYASELKVLSCQPTEFSLEGTQWGGGRGVFSYHLIDGMTGMADEDGNRQVSLYELQRYLQEKVPRETAPQPQMPFVVGDLWAAVAQVDAAALTALRQSKVGQVAGISVLKTKGLEDQVLSNADTSTQRLYALFRNALEQGWLLKSPDGTPSANDYYLQLAERPDIAPLYNLMRRNLAAALQDEAQQALNALLESDPYEVQNWRIHPEKYAQYPAYLARSIELLGDNHYLHNSLLAKKLFFDTYMLTRDLNDRENDPAKRENIRLLATGMIQQAIALDPTAPYLYYAMGSLYYQNVPYRSDSLQWWMEKTLEFSPHWLLPLLDIAKEYQVSQSDSRTAEKWIERALEIAPDSYVLLERLAWLRQWQNRTEEAIAICHRMIELKPDLPDGYITLANTLSFRREWEQACSWSNKIFDKVGKDVLNEKSNASFCLFKRRQPDAGKAFCDSIISDPRSTRNEQFFYALTAVINLCQNRRFEEAIPYLRLVDSIHFTLFEVVYAKVYEVEARFEQGRYEEADSLAMQVLHLDPSPSSHYARAYAWLGCIAARRGRYAAADSLFQKGVNYQTGNAWDDFWPLEEANYRYGRFLLDQNRLAEAKTCFEKANEYAFSNGYLGWYGLACLAGKQRDKTAVLNNLEKALDRWYPVPGPIYEEPLFKQIRKTKRFKTLMAKNFPPGWEKR